LLTTEAEPILHLAAGPGGALLVTAVLIGDIVQAWQLHLLNLCEPLNRAARGTRMHCWLPCSLTERRGRTIVRDHRERERELGQQIVRRFSITSIAALALLIAWIVARIAGASGVLTTLMGWTAFGLWLAVIIGIVVVRWRWERHNSLDR
jgi:Na+/glutamate symporter